MVEIPCE